MKLYIVADIEGVAGVVDEKQASGQSWHYEEARRQFTAEVNSVCMGAIEAGIEEIYVNDFHGNGLNLQPEKLPTQVMLIRGDFRPTSGFDLLDGTFDGLVLLGAHARTGTRNGVLPHTYSDKVRFEMFGQPIGEFDLIALIAGEVKVPTLLISGDSKTIEQAGGTLPTTTSVVTKYPLGCKGALCFHPSQICKMLKSEIVRAIKNKEKIEPPQIPPPIQLLVKVDDIYLADKLDWIPTLKRTENSVFEFAGDSMKQIAKLIYGITMLTA